MSKFIGLFEAKTHFSELIESIQEGDSVVITKRGLPVAEISAYSQNKTAKQKEAALRITNLRKAIAERYGDKDTMTLREMIEEGRS